MDVKTWTTISRLLDDALDLPPGARSTWLDGLDSKYDALKPQLRDLMAQAAAMDRADVLGTLPKFDPVDGDASRVDEPGDPSRVGALVGPYRLVRPIASGGQGAVWRAERPDGLVNRPVAIKLPHGLAFRPGLAERMARERDILASLSHPHIARLYDAGVSTEGEPYLALEYVDGTTIDAYTAARGLSTEARVRLFLQVVRAVAYAHGQLVIHRDLKPSNVLVTPEGQVRLLDFGIAKLLAADAPVDSTLTADTGRALTLPYASPEQVRQQPLGVATDVYSLGVVLFELLTGARPYSPVRESAAALEDAILTQEPRLASHVAPTPLIRRRLHGDLDTILAKALRKLPQERYASADALADDLQRHLDGLPVVAQPASRVYRLRKFVGRHRVGVAATAASLVAVMAGAGTAVWQAGVARAQRDSALVQQARAEATSDFLQSLLQQSGADTPLTATSLLERGAAQLESASNIDDAVLSFMQYEISTHFLRFNQTNRELALLKGSAARATAAGDDDLAAAAECSAAWAMAPRDLAAALAHLDAGERALARVKDASFRSHADCLRARARVMDLQGRPDEAIAFLEQGLAAHPPQRDRDWVKRSLVESLLSGLYRRAQRYGDALPLSEASLAEIRRHGQAGTLNELTGINNIAGNLSSLGEVRAASALYDELAAWLATDAKRVPPLGVQANIGFAELRLGRAANALRLADAELSASTRAGNPFAGAMANLLAARALVALGRTDDAGRRLDAAEAFWQGNPRGNARSLLEAAMCRAEIQAEGALEAARRAVAGLVSSLGFPASSAGSGLDRALRLSARLHLRAGDHATALAHAEGALEVLRRIARDPRQSADVGEASLLRAQALLALGRADEASAATDLAVAALTSGLGPDHALTSIARSLVAATSTHRDRPR